MATFYHDGDPACDKTNWGTSGQPSSFAPTNTNISNWIESYNAVGVQSVILTAKHGCGFLLWPTNVTLPDGSNYGYHVGGKGAIGIDIVSEFVHAMEAAGLAHSLYYSLKDSFYLNALGDNVSDAIPNYAAPQKKIVSRFWVPVFVLSFFLSFCSIFPFLFFFYLSFLFFRRLVRSTMLSVSHHTAHILFNI